AGDGGPRGPRLHAVTPGTARTTNRKPARPPRWPLHGPVTGESGPRRSPWTGKPEHHHGIDIGGPTGTPVRSPVEGTVVSTSSHGRPGKHGKVDHGRGGGAVYGPTRTGRREQRLLGARGAADWHA